jgi:bis(5'-adenosyl)-triphosphatase
MPKTGQKPDKVHCPFCFTLPLPGTILESRYFVAICNIAPILPGHTLIIPRKHTESLFSLTEEELTDLIFFTRKVAALLLKAFNTRDYNLSLQEGDSAGQTISHLHWHILPRIAGDLPEPGGWYELLYPSEQVSLDSPERQKLNPAELNNLASLIRNFLDAED